MMRLSTKQKREVYSLSSLLLHLLIFIMLLFSLNSCAEKELPGTNCATLATVKDMRGLDGCGFVLVLDNGRKLEPVYPDRGWCGTVPDEQLTALERFTLQDGQRVAIGYQESPRPSVCMVGQTVEITCISEVTSGY